MSARPQLLVVDDDREIRELLAGFLERHDFAVLTAADGEQMRRVLRESQVDLVVLDLMLPGEDGLRLCRALRAESELPVIMLTAMDEDTDRIVGLELGADDYVPKPCNPRELLARIRAVLRRARGASSPRPPPAGRLHFAGWCMIPAQRSLSGPDGHTVDLTAGEFDLLLVFADRAQRVLSRDELLDLTRGREAGPFDRSIDTQVSRLRRKIEPDPGRPVIIKTVRNGGYVFTPVVERD